MCIRDSINAFRIGFEWSAPWRYQRIWEVLSKQTNHSISDSHDLQRDYQSVLARRLVALLPEPTEDSHPGLGHLKQWDGKMREDSSAGALFAVWYYQHLQPALTAHLLPKGGDWVTELDSLAALQKLETPHAQQVALETLAAAWEATAKRLGDDPANWRWGDLHQMAFKHPLQARAAPDLAQIMGFTAYPRGGTANTTNNNGFDPATFAVRSGASFRMVLDVGLWDDAEVTNAPGQSGDPRSPFYANLLEGWARDSSIPLLYSKDAVEANQALRIQLTPAQTHPED